VFFDAQGAVVAEFDTDDLWVFADHDLADDMEE